MFEKTGEWFVGEGRRQSVTTRKASVKTLYINQVGALQEQTRFHYLAVEWTRTTRAVSDVLAPAPALRSQVTSTAGHAKKIFCAMLKGGDKT